MLLTANLTRRLRPNSGAIVHAARVTQLGDGLVHVRHAVRAVGVDVETQTKGKEVRL